MFYQDFLLYHPFLLQPLPNLDILFQVMVFLKKYQNGELYNRTQRREQCIIDAGFNLIVIWEDDFNRYY
jgi:hypothetical protein